MLKKSKKLYELEKDRYSILQKEMNTCYICKRKADDIHEVFGGSNRRTSMLNGFCVGLCRGCHNEVTFDSKKNLVLKKIMQMEYEKTHEREHFIKLIGKNYLEDEYEL